MSQKVTEYARMISQISQEKKELHRELRQPSLSSGTVRYIHSRLEELESAKQYYQRLISLYKTLPHRGRRNKGYFYYYIKLWSHLVYIAKVDELTEDEAWEVALAIKKHYLGMDISEIEDKRLYGKWTVIGVIPAEGKRRAEVIREAEEIYRAYTGAQPKGD